MKGTYTAYRLLLLGLLLFFCPTEGTAQYDHVLFQLKPAAEKGHLLYQSGAYEKAIPYLQQALRSDKGNRQLTLMLAHAYSISGKNTEAVRLFQQLQEKQALDTRHMLAFSHSLQALGRSNEAQQVYQKYLQQLDSNYSEEDVQQALQDLHRAAIRFSVHPLSINSRYNDFAPILTKEGLYFLSDRRKGALVRRSYSGHTTDLDLYQASARSNTRFTNITPLGSSVNSPLHEGPAAMDTTGALWFSRSDREGRITLWKAAPEAKANEWQTAQKIQIDAAGNLFHPAVSADGKVLFFVSDMPGGYGSTDIYYSLLKNGEWTAPVNAGPRINTPGSESFPTLLDNKLYFSSDGRIGMGGLDIFEAHLSGQKVVHVRNVGSPMNSSGDDFSLVWLQDGTGGYLASNRRGGRGGDDLYRFDYHIINLDGTLKDSTNAKPLAGATIELQLPDGSTRKAVSDAQGAYQFTLFPGEVYKLSFEAKDYRSRSFTYSTLQGKQYGARTFESALERKTKIFVLGTAKLPDSRRAASAQILVYNHAGGLPDTVWTNERGSYELELDTQSKYSFLASCDSWGAVADFETSERSEASLTHYLNIGLQQQQRYQVKGRIEGADAAQPLVVWLSSSLSGEQVLLWTEGAAFTFPASSLASYQLCVQQGGKSGTLHLGTNWQKEERPAVLELK